MSLQNATMVVTPPTFKTQLLSRICTLIDKQKEKQYTFQEPIFISDNFDVMDPIEVHGVRTDGIGELIIEAWNYADEEVDDIEGSLLYIEQLWELYMALEPIYQQRFNDYSVAVDA